MTYHNIIIAPSMTMSSWSQPGITVFKIDKTTLATSDLKMMFMPIEKTYSKLADSGEQFPFRVFDFRRFGLKDLSLSSF